MGGGGSGSTNTTSVNLPADVELYAQNPYFSGMSELEGRKRAFIGGITDPATYARQNSDETDGITTLVARAKTKSPIVTSGETLLQNIYDGIKLNTSPKIVEAWNKRQDELIQEFDEETIPRIEAFANAAGCFGGSSHHMMQAKAAESVMAKLVNMAAEIFAGDYYAERYLQDAALSLGIEYGTQTLNDAEALYKVGLYKREYAQGYLDEKHKGYLLAISRYIHTIEIGGNAIRALTGAYTDTTEPYYTPSPIAQVAGIALAGLPAIAAIFGGFGKTSQALPQGTASAMGAGTPLPAQVNAPGSY